MKRALPEPIYPSPEDARHARSILRYVWVNQNCISRSAVEWLEARALPTDATVLDCCARIAGVNLQGVKAYDHQAVAHRVSLAEVQASLPVGASKPHG